MPSHACRRSTPPREPYIPDESARVGVATPSLRDQIALTAELAKPLFQTLVSYSALRKPHSLVQS